MAQRGVFDHRNLDAAQRGFEVFQMFRIREEYAAVILFENEIDLRRRKTRVDGDVDLSCLDDCQEMNDMGVTLIHEDSDLFFVRMTFDQLSSQGIRSLIQFLIGRRDGMIVIGKVIDLS